MVQRFAIKLKLAYFHQWCFCPLQNAPPINITEFLSVSLKQFKKFIFGTTISFINVLTLLS